MTVYTCFDVELETSVPVCHEITEALLLHDIFIGSSLKVFIHMAQLL